MGTWGSGPFDNDDAADWVYELTADADERVVEAALSAAAEEGYLDASTSQAAVAAAEVVAAGLDRPYVELPDEVAAWVAVRRDAGWSALAQVAVRAVSRVLDESELRELWDEASDGEAWTADVTDLLERLAPDT
jgi:hypothetical protein